MSWMLALAAPDASQATANHETIWLFSEAKSGSWCAVTDETAARAIAASDRFANGSSAVMHLSGATLRSVTALSESEDAYVEDTYYFDEKLGVSSLVRHGHYIADPFFSVTYVRAAGGDLVLTPKSRQTRQRQETLGRETYFLDWPKYPSFEKFPFADVVQMRALAAVTRHC